MTRITPAVHPGEILREEYLAPLRLTPYALAKHLGIPRTRIERLVREETPVTPDTALRLGRVFKTSPGMWLNLQSAYDVAITEKQISQSLADIKPLGDGVAA